MTESGIIAPDLLRVCLTLNLGQEPLGELPGATSFSGKIFVLHRKSFE